MTREKDSIERIADENKHPFDTVKAKFMSGTKDSRKLTIPQTTQQSSARLLIPATAPGNQRRKLLPRHGSNGAT
jgi:hypothetical protein